jgi:hypothetical protein
VIEEVVEIVRGAGHLMLNGDFDEFRTAVLIIHYIVRP